MKYIVRSAGDTTKVITEEDGIVTVHIEGQPEVTDLVMPSESFDSYLGEASSAQQRRKSVRTTL